MIRRLYQDHLKKFPTARRLAGFYRGTVMAAKNSRVKVLSLVAPRWKIQSQDAFAQETGLHHEDWTASAEVATPRPRVFPRDAWGVLQSPRESYRFPGVRFQELPDAVVSGSSNLVQLADRVVHHDLYDLDQDETSEECHVRIGLDLARQELYWVGQRRPSRVFPRAAVFTDGCAWNYAHWLTEVAPRIAQFVAHEKVLGTPILVNRGLHSNIEESLGLIVGGAFPVVRLAEKERVRVDRLSVVTPTGYVPYGQRETGLASREHGVFCPASLTAMRDRLREALGVQPRSLGRKLWLRRNAGVRHLLNNDEIESAVRRLGYEIIEPERLTFSQQVALFAQAEVIIGPTGSAMANMIFCPPGARVIVLHSRDSNGTYWYWQNIARAIGLDATYVFGDKLGDLSRGIHCNYTVRTQDVVDAVEAAACVS